jgi:hypothetical protein
MTCLPTAGFKIQEFGFVALEAFRHGLLGVVVDEFADVKDSGWWRFGEQQGTKKKL